MGTRLPSWARMRKTMSEVNLSLSASVRLTLIWLKEVEALAWVWVPLHCESVDVFVFTVSDKKISFFYYYRAVVSFLHANRETDLCFRFGLRSCLECDRYRRRRTNRRGARSASFRPIAASRLLKVRVKLGSGRIAIGPSYRTRESLFLLSSGCSDSQE